MVDCSGTLPVMNRPASELTRSKTLEGHLNCFLSFWAIPKYYPGLTSGYACEVWKKMMSIGEDFNRGFRQEKWRAPELMKNLLKECERLEQKFKDGQQLSEQCRLMKQEALQEASLRRPLPPADFLNYVPPTDDIPPWDLPSAGKGRVPEPAEKGRVPEPVRKGKVPLHPQGTPPRNQPKQKARPKPAKPLPPPGPPPWARPLQPARAWQVLRRLSDDNPWGGGNHNQNRSKLLGLLLAGFSPRPSNLGCSLGTVSKQDRHTLLSPLMSRNSLCKRIAGAETECPSLLDLHPDAKQDRQLATNKAECQSLLDLHQDVKQDGRLLDTKKAECRSLLDRRRQSSLAKESPRPCRCSHLPRKLRRQVLLLLNSARHFRSTPRMWRCPKSFQRSRPTVSLRGTWSERAGKASFRHFRASAERPRPWPKRVRASTHTSSERAVQVRLILLLCHSWVTFYIFWVLKPNQE